MKKIFWSLVILLELACAGILFHAAMNNNLPAEVSRIAWTLGGCCVVIVVVIGLEEFYFGPKTKCLLKGLRSLATPKKS